MSDRCKTFLMYRTNGMHTIQIGHHRGSSLESLPLDIQKLIFQFCSHPVADIFKKTVFFAKVFPYLYCPQTVWRETMNNMVFSDYRSMMQRILKHRHLQPNYRPWKYYMFHVHCANGNDGDKFFTGIDRLFSLGMLHGERQKMLSHAQRLDLWQYLNDIGPS